MLEGKLPTNSSSIVNLGYHWWNYHFRVQITRGSTGHTQYSASLLSTPWVRSSSDAQFPIAEFNLFEGDINHKYIKT